MIGEEINRKRYISFGILFLGLQVLAIVRNLSSDYFSFFWYCDFTPVLFALFFFIRNNQAIKGLLNIGLLAQLGFVILFLIKLFFGVSLFGFDTDFPLNFYYITITIVLHLSTLFVFILTYKIKPEKTSLIYSFVFLSLIYLTVIVFTSPSYVSSTNYNYIYHADIFPNVPHYTQLWTVLAFTLVVLPTYFFQIYVYEFHRKGRERKIKGNK